MLIISCFSNNNDGWAQIFIGFFFGGISAIGFLLETFEREIIDNNKIILECVLSKDIEYSLSEIKFVEYKNKAFHFYDKYHTYRFKSRIKNGINEFIEIIKDNANIPKVNFDYITSESFIEVKEEIINSDYTNEEIIAISKIGKEYKDKYLVRKRNLKIKSISIFIFICLILILIAIFSSWITLVFILFFPIPCLIGYFLCEDSLTSELKIDDFTLGLKNRIVNKDSFNND